MWFWILIFLVKTYGLFVTSLESNRADIYILPGRWQDSMQGWGVQQLSSSIWCRWTMELLVGIPQAGERTCRSVCLVLCTKCIKWVCHVCPPPACFISESTDFCQIWRWISIMKRVGLCWLCIPVNLHEAQTKNYQISENRLLVYKLSLRWTLGR
jgi:hypothetical protein